MLKEEKPLRTKPSSRGGIPLATPSPHTSPSVSCRARGAGGSPLEENTIRRMFTKLGPPLAPPAASCRLWKRKSRSTLSSTMLPRDHTLYLKEARDERGF
ncbi:hypothetical protein INR49_025603 [Caranx melampygus]|nr:hypothetical protein INR49_025603 [Caranx melampygus]